MTKGCIQKPIDSALMYQKFSSKDMARNWIQGYPEVLLAAACFFFFFFKFNKESTVPISWPIVGMLPGLLANLHHLHEWATHVLRESGCTIQFHAPRFLAMDYIATCDPANVNHIFNVNFSNYPKGQEFLEIFDVLGDGIFNADADSWKSQRRKAHSLMSRPQFRSFVAKCSRDKVENGLVPLLTHVARQGAVVDLQDVFLRLTFDVTCDLVFGINPESLSLELPIIPFSKAMDDVTEALLFRHAVPPSWWKLMRWLRIGKEKKVLAAQEVINHFVAQNIARKKVEKHHQEDLLTAYIADTGEHEDKFLRDTAVNFMIAGRDTTGVALAWFFWLLAENPEAKSRILRELKEHYVLEKKGLCLDSEELTKLVYLHAALLECLRLFPPVPFEHKGALLPEILPSGHPVRAGTKIVFSTYSMGRMEGVWGKDCLEFKPERWISAGGRIRHEPSYKFLSFNCGPRTCLGKDMAFAQMKTVAAALIWNFDVEVVEGHIVEPKVSIILHMKNGLMVKLKERKHGEC